MISDDLLGRLEHWYWSQVNGEWEHSFGVEIGTLDNPGWTFSVDLGGTALEDRAFTPMRVDKAREDWYECKVDSNVFLGFGGPGNLRNLVSVFLEFAASHMNE